MIKTHTENENALRLRKIINRNVKVLMALNDTKQKDLAEVLGITQGTVSLKLKGETSWTVDDIAIISSYFNVDPSDLVDEHAFMGNREGFVAPAGARYFVRPEDGDGRNPGRNGRARAFVMPGATGWGSVPRVGTEPLFVFAGLGVDRETAAVRRFALLCALGSRDAIIRRG